MCGGELMIATCSHVGHVFRKSTPYTFPGGTSRIVNHNNARLAEVWLDEWKEFYFSINPGYHSLYPHHTGCSIYFLPISNGYISEPFHISTYVVKTKIGLRSGSFIWQIFNFQKNKKKVKVSTKVLIF